MTRDERRLNKVARSLCMAGHVCWCCQYDLRLANVPRKWLNGDDVTLHDVTTDDARNAQAMLKLISFKQ